MHCPNCGTDLPEGAVFCVECGTDLNAFNLVEDTESSGTKGADTSGGTAAPEDRESAKKKRTPIIAALIALILAAVGGAVFLLNRPAPTVEITAKMFPDKNVLAFVSKADKNGDGFLSPEEASVVTDVEIDDVVDTTGLEYLPKAKRIRLSGPELTTATISAPEVEELDLSGSPKLVEVNITEAAPELKKVNMDKTDIEKIDLSHSEKLEEVTVPEDTKVTLPDSISDEESVRKIVKVKPRTGMAPPIWIIESVSGSYKHSTGDGDQVFSEVDVNTVGTYRDDGRLIESRKLNSNGETYDAATYTYDKSGHLTEYVGKSFDIEPSSDPGYITEAWKGSWASDGTNSSWAASSTATDMGASFKYNSLGLPTSFQGTNMHVGNGGDSPSATYTYDDAGRLSGMKVKRSGNENDVAISYSGDGILSEIVISNEHFSTTYKFNERGRLTSRSEYTAYNSETVTTEYTFDEDGNPTGAKQGGTEIATFETDENGNIVKIHGSWMTNNPSLYTVEYELTWRKVEAYEDGSYPFGVAGLLDPLMLDSSELFTPVSGGNPSSLLELERLIRQSQALAMIAPDTASSSTGKEQSPKKDDKDSSEDKASADTAAAAETHISATNFEFDIPEYWAGKVEWSEGEDGVVSVYPKGYPNRWLMDVSVQNGSSPMAMGDISTGCVAYTTGGDTHLEAWRTRYVYGIGAMRDEYSREEAEVLLDLSTFGQVDLDTVYSMSVDELNGAMDLISTGDDIIRETVGNSLVQK